MPKVTLDPVDPKDPGETKLYTMDWTGGLPSGDTISASSWVVPEGITKDADAIVTGNLKTTIKLSGGRTDQDYECTNTVITSGGETLKRTGIVSVRKL